ncbi:hypothetical protein BLOT_001102 [Blomia tropicalis]|nr:hypothetical protein BLOT_001102 [Blomia tropicalis]
MITETTLAQKKRNRGRKGNKGSDQCHQKEVVKCFDKLHAFNKEDEPTSILATSQGLNRICKTIKDDTMRCVKTYFKKCGTPLHREISDLVMDMVVHRVSRFCDNSQQKSLLRTTEFKKSCNTPFLSVVGKIDLHHLKADDAHESLCCGFNTWYDCTSSSIKNQCQSEGVRVFREFHNSTLGPITDIFCPADVFPSSSSSCKKIHNNSKAKSGSKPPENMISKMIVNLAPFLIDTKN